MTDQIALIGIDVGGTTTSAGLVTREGEILAFAQRPTRGGGTPVDVTLALVSELTARARGMGMALAGIGVGLPGLVDADKGMMIYAVNYVPEFAHLPLADLLRDSTGLTTFVDNDVNVLALGEHRFGVARGADSLVMLAIGTGVGGAMIVGETLIRGHAGCAGEFGHFPIDPRGPLCRGGHRGCLNSWTAGTSIAERGRERAVAAPRSALMDLAGGDPNGITAELVFRAASAGDLAATEIVVEACQALGAVVGAIMSTINPEVIVITGGVAQSLVPLEGDIRRHAARFALPQAVASTAIHLVPGDKRRTVLGGAALFLYEIDQRRKPLESGRT
ncbi:MAG: ROK family protein [Candidatus Rokuibacteriota bacterium]